MRPSPRSLLPPCFSWLPQPVALTYSMCQPASIPSKSSIRSLEQTSALSPPSILHWTTRRGWPSTARATVRGKLGRRPHRQVRAGRHRRGVRHRLNFPEGLAFDSAGNLFVSSENPANSSDSTIVRLTSNGTASVFASGLDFPNGLAFDSAGNLYVANTDNSTIMKFAPNGTGSLFARTPYPDGLAFDSAGNLYASNIEGGISKFSPTGTGLGTFGTVSGVGEGLAFDSAGNLYVASGQTITRFAPSGAGSVFATAAPWPTLSSSPSSPVSSVPEPATREMAVLGLLALLVLVRPKAKA